ncbi:MAG: hypothetical protein ACOC93_06110, partial [Planctomycetota bacterium]
MKHLTNEQLEELFAGGQDAPAHLSACADCQARLSEKRELAARLHSAFDSVQPREEFLAALQQRVQAEGQHTRPPRNVLQFPGRWRLG